MKAKFLVQSVTHYAGDNISVTLSAAKQGPDDNDNYQFWKYTPNGELTMEISNPKAKDFFKPGEYYYLDFSPVKDALIS